VGKGLGKVGSGRFCTDGSGLDWRAGWKVLVRVSAWPGMGRARWWPSVAVLGLGLGAGGIRLGVWTRSWSYELGALCWGSVGARKGLG